MALRMTWSGGLDRCEESKGGREEISRADGIEEVRKRRRDKYKEEKEGMMPVRKEEMRGSEKERSEGGG